MILSITAFALAVALYAISQLQQQSKLRGQKGDASFWGERSWQRKWKFNSGKHLTMIQVVHTNMEAFWGSSRWFVFVTDGYHFCQFLFTILFCISAVSYEREFGFWIDGGIYWGTWKLVFWAIYNSLQKK